MRPPWLEKEEDVTTAADREFYRTMGALTWGSINFVPGAQAPRRMAGDKTGDSVWVANFFGNNLARIDIRSLETKYYRLPMMGSSYGVDVDKDHNPWVHLHGDDTLGKLDPRTGNWTIYQLPSRGCSPRDVRVDNIRGDVWAACREAARVARLQFRTAQDLDAMRRQTGAAAQP
jgi:streptogramin lyase